jgi:hypothetical protein
MSKEVTLIPTWCYRMSDTGETESQLVEIEAGKLPDGWVDSPAKLVKPKAKA